MSAFSSRLETLRRLQTMAFKALTIRELTFNLQQRSNYYLYVGINRILRQLCNSKICFQSSWNSLSDETYGPLNEKVSTGIPDFQKFTIHHLTLTKDLHQNLFLAERNLKRIFIFTKKRQKLKIALSICLAASHYRGSKQHQSGSFSRNYTQHLSSSCQSFELCL